MMKHLIVPIALAVLASASAAAQNPGQIARAQSGADCPGCNLFQADLSYRALDRADFSRARLRQADLSLSTFNDARFDGADLVTANLFAARFTGARFMNADLSRATGRGPRPDASATRCRVRRRRHHPARWIEHAAVPHDRPYCELSRVPRLCALALAL